MNNKVLLQNTPRMNGINSIFSTLVFGHDSTSTHAIVELIQGSSQTVVVERSINHVVNSQLLADVQLVMIDISIPSFQDDLQRMKLALRSHSNNNCIYVGFSSDSISRDEAIKLQMMGIEEVLRLSDSTKINHLKVRNIRLKLKNLEHSNNALNHTKAADLIKSVSYAGLIQQGMMSSIEDIKRKFGNTSVLYKPKECLGGDFYWIENINGKHISICGDNSGHGVPGAMLAVFSYYLIENIIREQREFDPGVILTKLHRKFISSFSNDLCGVHYSLDISVCIFNEQENTLSYASAKSPVLLQMNNSISKLEIDVVSVGDTLFKDHVFQTNRIILNDYIRLFQYSDGFVDQFGGNENKKLKKRGLIDQLKSMMHMPIQKIDDDLAEFFEAWKGDREQVDDVTVIGTSFGG